MEQVLGGPASSGRGPRPTPPGVPTFTERQWKAMTPAQRRANAKFQKASESSMGQPHATYVTPDQRTRPRGWVTMGLLLVCILGPLLIEYVRVVPFIWGLIKAGLAKLGLY